MRMWCVSCVCTFCVYVCLYVCLSVCHLGAMRQHPQVSELLERAMTLLELQREHARGRCWLWYLVLVVCEVSAAIEAVGGFLGTNSSGQSLSIVESTRDISDSIGNSQ